MMVIGESGPLRPFLSGSDVRLKSHRNPGKEVGAFRFQASTPQQPSR
jgi:hypothetical protein